MSKTVPTLAVVIFALVPAASAVAAQDYRSPDSRPTAVTQDFRSPDASQQTRPVTQDLRSPDARASARPAPAVPSLGAHASNTFDWAYLALAIATALIGLAGFVIAQRRRRHGLAIGG
jgi:hypothetical protein